MNNIAWFDYNTRTYRNANIGKPTIVDDFWNWSIFSFSVWPLNNVIRPPMLLHRRPIFRSLCLSGCRVVYCGFTVQDRPCTLYRSRIGMWDRHFDWYHFRSLGSAWPRKQGEGGANWGWYWNFGQTAAGSKALYWLALWSHDWAFDCLPILFTRQLNPLLTTLCPHYVQIHYNSGLGLALFAGWKIWSFHPQFVGFFLAALVLMPGA